MTEKLILGEAGFAQQISADIAINPTDLDTAYIQHGSLYAYYAEQSRQASKKADNFKLRIATVESDLGREIRDEAAVSGSKITEKAIEQAIASNQRYVDTVQAYNDAKATAQMLRDILDAFKQRKDMLVQLGLNRRDEAKSKLLLKENTEDELAARRERFAAK